jgi:precorrin-2 dehydrogenase / sirohydrochlorin ferrochelatase
LWNIRSRRQGVLPIILKNGRVGLAGAGEALERRRKFLSESGIEAELIGPQITPERLTGFTAFFVAGLSHPESERLAAVAHEAKVLVNVEDQPDLCDFFVPAVVRRGDLLIAISTSGRSPGLAKLLRQWIERNVGLVWADRLAEASTRRAAWRAAGTEPADVARKTSDLINARGWLA